ncbi:MAG: mandelate racemase [Cohaesibacteraceae bacterium]
MAPRFTIQDVRVEYREVIFHLPFQFGSTQLTHAREAFVTVELEAASGCFRGLGAQMLIPRWFDKRLHLTNDDTVDELVMVLETAQRRALGLSGTVRQVSSELRMLVRDAVPADCPDLAAGFGPAVLEMAIIDAACRSEDLPFVDAARGDLFGLADDAPSDIDADTIRSTLAGLSASESIQIRHTVGYDAPLVREEVYQTLADGRPVALDDVISSTGIRAFKIKLKGDVDADLSRLVRIAALLAGKGDYTATLDANEQYEEDAFSELVAHFKRHPDLEDLRMAVAFFEQPFARDVALADRDRPFDLGVPIVIDESDATDDALPRAWSLGWAGTSVKSCKGVLRSLLNKVRTDKRVAEGHTALLSAEDLTCQPGLGWQQDTMMATCIGARHVERNGHHFAGGMQGAREAEKAALLKCHPGLYRPGKLGPQLAIENGQVDLSSLFGVGFASAPLHAHSNITDSPARTTSAPIALQEY